MATAICTANTLGITEQIRARPRCDQATTGQNANPHKWHNIVRVAPSLGAVLWLGVPLLPGRPKPIRFMFTKCRIEHYSKSRFIVYLCHCSAIQPLN